MNARSVFILLFLTIACSSEEPSVQTQKPKPPDPPDVTAPVLTVDETSLRVRPFQKFAPKYTAIDSKDGDITANVKISYRQNFGVTNQYDIIQHKQEFISDPDVYLNVQTVVFDVSDKAGNTTSKKFELTVYFGPYFLDKEWCTDSFEVFNIANSSPGATKEICEVCIRLSNDKQYGELIKKSGQTFHTSYFKITSWRDNFKFPLDPQLYLLIYFTTPPQYKEYVETPWDSRYRIFVEGGEGHIAFLKPSASDYNGEKLLTLDKHKWSTQGTVNRTLASGVSAIPLK